MSILRAHVPRKLAPLLHPKRYKGAYGGRGGAKSHFFAEQVVLRMYMQPTRVVCIREVQNSIKDSVHQLLTDKIQALGLNDLFEVLETEIRGPNGSFCIFKGMRSYNATNIKSLEAFDVAWVEEAQTLSQTSLDMLRPTLRKPGSELWFSWNPRFKTDPVDVFFRKSPPPDAISVLINWIDNPWFPDVLRKEMEHDFTVDEDKAEHIWNGAYGNAQGSILGKWVSRAEREGRIHDEVAYDPEGAQIVISSDIGFRDTASWWFWQSAVGGHRLLAYDGDSGLDADDWIPRVREKLGELGAKSPGMIWLPQDAKAKTFQSKLTSIERFVKAFGHDRVRDVPPSTKSDQISAARGLIGRCEFHKTLCEAGLDGLSAWQFKYIEEANTFSREPDHNWASHPSDAFAYGCQVVSEPVPPRPLGEATFPVKGTKSGRIQTAPLSTLWRDRPSETRY